MTVHHRQSPRASPFVRGLAARGGPSRCWLQILDALQDLLLVLLQAVLHVRRREAVHVDADEDLDAEAVVDEQNQQ